LIRCQNFSARRALIANTIKKPTASTVTANTSACGCCAQKEMSKAGRSGSSGGRGSSPWVSA